MGSKSESESMRELMKAHVLELYDYTMLGLATSYDLEDSKDKLRSTKDLERFFFQLVRVFQPGLFIEAGAKDAGSSRRARKFLEDARIVAFEANPFTHKRFRQRNASPELRVEYLHKALSDSDGSVTFNVRTRDDGKPSADGQGSLKEFKDEKNEFTRVTVDATTLDGFFADYDGDTCALWVDVEGAQRAVLEGGNELLKKAAAVMIEVEDRRVWDQDWLRPEIVAYLYDHGLVPVARDFQSRYLYNIVFVRDSLRSVDRYRWALTKLHSDAGKGRSSGRNKAKQSKAGITAQGSSFLSQSVQPAVGRFIKKIKSSR